MFDKNEISKLYPGAEELMFEPMLINKVDDEKLRIACESGDYFGQLKKDGGLYYFVKNGNSYLFGRTISVTTKLSTEKSANVPHIIEKLNSLPDNTIILGEIYYPGKSSKNVVSIMGCLPEKAIERQNGSYGKIHYYIYDILKYDGVNLMNTPAYDRYRILTKVAEKHNILDEYVELAEMWEDNLYARIGQALANGEEGMVIKKKTGYYEPGKRPMTNLKAKKVDFIDAIIIGFEEPTKEYYGKESDTWDFYKDGVQVTKAYYYGWHNSKIKIGAYLNDKIIEIGTISSGISDDMKKDMTENPNNYLGKVVAIQCMELDKDAKTLRHGFLQFIRNDKPSTDCTIENIFG